MHNCKYCSDGDLIVGDLMNNKSMKFISYECTQKKYYKN